MAGSSPSSQTLEVAGELGWWPMSTFFLHSSNLPMHWEAYAKGASAAGRAVSRSQWRIAREVFVADNTEQAVSDVMHGPPATRSPTISSLCWARACGDWMASG